MKIIIIYFFLFTFWVTDTIGFSLTGVKGLSLTNLSFYLLFLVWPYTIVFKKKLLEWNSVNTYVIIFIFFGILSIPYNILLDETPNMGLRQNIINFKKWVEPFILLFIMTNIIDDKETCKRALLGLGILLFITALSGPLTLFNIINIGRTTASGRASGFGGDTNEFAAYLVLFIPLVLTFVFFHKSYFLRAYGFVLLLVTSFSLLLSGSRGGLLSFLVSMFGYLFMLYSQKMIRLQTLSTIIVVVSIFSALSFAAAPTMLKKSISYRLDPTQYESVEKFSAGRLWIWQNAIKLFSERPIFGHGHRSIAYLMARRFGERRVAHNQYMNYLVELGIVGCILFILIFLKIFRVMWNYQKLTPDLWDKKLYIGYVAGLLGYTSSMLFVNLGWPRYIFWFYTAVILRYGQLKKIGENS